MRSAVGPSPEPSGRRARSCDRPNTAQPQDRGSGDPAGDRCEPRTAGSRDRHRLSGSTPRAAPARRPTGTSAQRDLAIARRPRRRRSDHQYPRRRLWRPPRCTPPPRATPRPTVTRPLGHRHRGAASGGRSRGGSRRRPGLWSCWWRVRSRCARRPSRPAQRWSCRRRLRAAWSPLPRRRPWQRASWSTWWAQSPHPAWSGSRRDRAWSTPSPRPVVRPRTRRSAPSTWRGSWSTASRSRCPGRARRRRTPAPTSAGGDDLVDLNTADAAALDALPGIGPVLAEQDRVAPRGRTVHDGRRARGRRRDRPDPARTPARPGPGVTPTALVRTI